MRVFVASSSLALAAVLFACSDKTIVTSAAPSAVEDGGVTAEDGAAPCTEGPAVDLGAAPTSTTGLSMAVAPGFVAIAHDSSIEVVGLDGTVRSDTSLPQGWFPDSVAANAERIVVSATENYGDATPNGRFTQRVAMVVLDSQGTMVLGHTVLSPPTYTDPATMMTSGGVTGWRSTVLTGTTGFVITYSLIDIGTTLVEGTVAARWLGPDGVLTDTKQTLLTGATAMQTTPSFALDGKTLFVASKSTEDAISTTSYLVGGSGAPTSSATLGAMPTNEYVLMTAASEQGFLVATSSESGTPSSHVTAVSTTGKTTAGAHESTTLSGLRSLPDGRFVGVLGTDLAFFDGAGTITQRRALPTSTTTPSLAVSNGQIMLAWADAAGEVRAQSFCY